MSHKSGFSSGETHPLLEFCFASSQESAVQSQTAALLRHTHEFVRRKEPAKLRLNNLWFGGVTASKTRNLDAEQLNLFNLGEEVLSPGPQAEPLKFKLERTHASPPQIFKLCSPQNVGM
jgi:hypothetical protein